MHKDWNCLWNNLFLQNACHSIYTLIEWTFDATESDWGLVNTVKKRLSCFNQPISTPDDPTRLYGSVYLRFNECINSSIFTKHRLIKCEETSSRIISITLTCLLNRTIYYLLKQENSKEYMNMTIFICSPLGLNINIDITIGCSNSVFSVFIFCLNIFVLSASEPWCCTISTCFFWTFVFIRFIFIFLFLFLAAR